EPVAAQTPGADDLVPEPLATSAADKPPEPATPSEPRPADVEHSAAAPSPGEPSPLARVQIEERLSIALTRVEFARVPLAQFVQFIADASGVPVTIDEVALTKAGKDRQTPISVKLAATTAGDALRAALVRAGLECTVRDGKIVVTTRAAVRSER